MDEKTRTTASTLERVESWLAIAKELGYRVRYDHFGGSGGGVCEFGGQKWIFMDVSLNTCEQLEQLKLAIPRDPQFLAVQSKAA